MTIMITGIAGFIGAALAHRLLASGAKVIGIDNMNDYYDVQLKRDRLATLTDVYTTRQFRFYHLDISDRDRVAQVFADDPPTEVVNLAAQASVYHGIKDPYSYADSNLSGFLHILENCRHHGTKHLLYASSSSVYGANPKLPCAVSDNVDHPLSLYAATKKANELMAHCYSHLHSLPTTGFRFFTVYGPWGRPDMALFLFTQKILADQPIELYNYGQHSRSFTYIDDIIDGIVPLIHRPAQPDPHWEQHPDPATSSSPYAIYNIGHPKPESLLRYVEVLEDCLGRKAKRNLLPLQLGDVINTSADVAALEAAIDYCPSTTIETGIARFVDWYKTYYRVS